MALKLHPPPRLTYAHAAIDLGAEVTKCGAQRQLRQSSNKRYRKYDGAVKYMRMYMYMLSTMR